MIHILGLLLKTIGWILLGILGVILGILLLVLFSAIRYTVAGKKQGRALEGQIKVTWLLWILSVLVTYKEGLEVRIKVFGRTIRKLDLRGGAAGQDEIGGTARGQEDTGGRKETPAGPRLEPAPDRAGTDSRGWAWEPKGPGGPDGPENSPVDKKAGEEPQAQGGHGDQKTAGRVSVNSLEGKAADKGAEKGERTSLGSRCKEAFLRLWERICALYQKLLAQVRAFGDRVEAVQEKLGQLQEKWEKFQAFLQDPANQKSAKLIFRQTKKILRHLFPRKGRAQITFGLEDPYQMGQVLSAAACLYPFTHDLLTLSPVFDEKILEGEIWIKGHIRIGMLLGHVLRLLLDQNIRRQLWGLIRPSRGKRRGGKEAGPIEGRIKR